MSLPLLAAIEDLEAWLGQAVSNPERADAILTAASTLVRSQSGRTWVGANGEPNEGLTEVQLESARTVVLMVAARVWNNPYGTTQEATGPFSRSVAAWAALGMELTDTERSMLGTSANTGLWSLRTTRDDFGLADIYLDVVDSEPIPHVPQGSVNW